MHGETAKFKLYCSFRNQVFFVRAQIFDGFGPNVVSWMAEQPIIYRVHLNCRTKLSNLYTLSTII